MQTVPSPMPFGSGLMTLAPKARTRTLVAEEPERLRTLMAAAQDGDGVAYQALLRECVPMIRRMARQNGIVPEAVDDVVQDALITIHRARHTFDRTRPLTPWLRAIVQRRGIDLQRRRGRQASRELHVPVAYEAYADPATGADQVVVEQGRAARLAAAVAQLPPGQRQALEELGLQERTLAEASVRTGRSVGALKVNLHRALKSLRVILGGDER